MVNIIMVTRGRQSHVGLVAAILARPYHAILAKVS